MSSLVSAMDKHTPKQIGENVHVEYAWSHDLDEKITQLFFQLVRSKSVDDISKIHMDILHKIKRKEKMYKKQFTIIYKLIAQTRDIVSGKGEQQLAFILIYNMYKAGYVNLAIDAVSRLLEIDNEHPYGSWKDAKYLCKFIRDDVYKETSLSKEKVERSLISHPLVKHVCMLMINRLRKDYSNYQIVTGSASNSGESKESLYISLVSRWFPREKSSFGWVNAIAAFLAYPQFFNNEMSNENYKKSLLKARIKLKKMYVPVNKYLETTQIAQCSGEWKTINFNKVTSCTMRKQSRAFSNKDKKGEKRSNLEDRVICANNFSSHIEAVKSKASNHKMHGRRCNVGELTKDALNVHDYEQSEIDRINLQWEDNKKNNKALGNIIACCDTSGSMEMDDMIPLTNAIGLSIRTSEVVDDAFKHRIMTFNDTPEWIQLNDQLSFVEKVKQVKRSPWGMNTNIYAMFDLLLNVILENNIPPSKVENLVLAIFSDMQIDSAVSHSEINASPDKTLDSYMNTLYDNIKDKFHKAGLRSKYKTPYQPPHILFWNLRKTSGFPVLSTQKNVSMLSGYSSTLLNIFCNKGVDELKQFTPRKLLEDIIDADRFSYMDEPLEKFYNTL